jgi:hypothetical protein
VQPQCGYHKHLEQGYSSTMSSRVEGVVQWAWLGVVCLVAALILIFEVYRHERTRNMEALLQKSRKDMRWGGITDNDVEVLKKRYPNINWDSTYDRERWQKGTKYLREKKGRKKARQKLR